MSKIKLLDCTMRDGGYYNAWDFDKKVINEYLKAMSELAMDYVELGLRSFQENGYKGPCAYTTDNFLNSLNIPANISIGVMVNANELIAHEDGVVAALNELFIPKVESPVSLVRIACHTHEFEQALVGAEWLKEQGYIVGYNLMQIASKSEEEISELANLATKYPIDVLYFADSLGGLNPSDVSIIIKAIRRYWKGELGVHTHDNLGNALSNSLQAIEDGATWIDSTVTGMGRGPGNVKTEYLVLAVEEFRDIKYNLTPLMNLINHYFKDLQVKYGWGTNTYYYLAGKYGIHPTYIQEMLSDSRFVNEDILSVIEYLKLQSSHKFSKSILTMARKFYIGDTVGKWNPKDEIENRKVLILGTGPGILKYKDAIEEYIRCAKPYVIALNTQNIISNELIDVRAACHPTRLMADIKTHLKLPQPLITPFSMLEESIQEELNTKCIKDYGISSELDEFVFSENSCNVPKILVVAYALAVANSGGASEILLTGFDGYPGEDIRNEEMNNIFEQYFKHPSAITLKSITPTKYNLDKGSIFKMIGDVE